MRTILFAQSVIDYAGISVRTAFRDAFYSAKSWFRSDQQTAWMLVVGMVLLVFFLRRKRRHY
jgi:hypothetical protein